MFRSCIINFKQLLIIFCIFALTACGDTAQHSTTYYLLHPERINATMQQCESNESFLTKNENACIAVNKAYEQLQQNYTTLMQNPLLIGSQIMHLEEQRVAATKENNQARLAAQIKSRLYILKVMGPHQ